MSPGAEVVVREIAWLREVAAFLATTPDGIPYRAELLRMGGDIAGCADRLEDGLAAVLIFLSGPSGRGN